MAQFAYVILTCDAYADRLKAITDTWARDRQVIPLGDDLTYVTGYESCPHKYVSFFETEDVMHDWYVFADDDTYIRPAELEAHLSTLPDAPTSIGDFRYAIVKSGEMLVSGSYDRPHNVIFPRGGAGFAVNKNAMLALQQYVRRSGFDLPITANSDTTIGMWMDLSDPPVQKVYDKRFCRVYDPKRMKAKRYWSLHYATPGRLWKLHRGYFG